MADAALMAPHPLLILIHLIRLLLLGSLNPPVPVLCQGVKEPSGRLHPQRIPLTEIGTS